MTDLFNEIDNPRKRAFLIAFVENGEIKASAAAADTSETGVWYWRRDDPQFLEAFNVARKIYDHNYLNILETELKKRSLDRSAPMSTVALFFALKAEAPQKYRETVPEARLTGEITIKLSLPDRQYKEIEGKYNLIEEGKDAIKQGETSVIPEGKEGETKERHT